MPTQGWVDGDMDRELSALGGRRNGNGKRGDHGVVKAAGVDGGGIPVGRSHVGWRGARRGEALGRIDCNVEAAARGEVNGEMGDTWSLLGTQVWESGEIHTVLDTNHRWDGDRVGDHKSRDVAPVARLSDGRRAECQ